MPEASIGGVVLIGSSDTGMQRMLDGFIGGNFNRKVLYASDTSDFLLEMLNRQVALSILDINLAGLPVAKTIQIIRKCRPRVPIIVLSDDYSVATGSSIMEHGVFYYVYKPLDMDRFLEVVKSALRKREREESEERR